MYWLEEKTGGIRRQKRNQQCVKLEKDVPFIRVIRGYLFGVKEEK